MRDSDTYMAIFDEGRELQIKESILRLGQKKLGPAGPAVATQLEGITDLERLERIFDRLLDDVPGWRDLLATP